MKHLVYFSLPCLLLLSCLSVNSYAEAPLETASSNTSSKAHMERLYEEGKKAFREEKWSEARSKFKLLNDQYPNSPYLASTFFVILKESRSISQKQFEKDLNDLKALIKKSKQSKELSQVLLQSINEIAVYNSYEEVFELVQGEHWDKAMKKGQALIASYPDSIYLENTARLVFYCKAELEGIKKAFEKLYDFLDRHPRGTELREPLLKAAGEYEVAVDWNDSCELMQNEKWGAAIAKLYSMNSKYPNNPCLEKAKINIAICWCGRGLPREAMRELRNFIKQHPDSKLIERAKKLEVKTVCAVYRWDVAIVAIIVYKFLGMEIP